AERFARAGGADAEAADHDRDARSLRLAGDRLDRAGVNLGRAGAVRGDPRQRAVARALEQALIDAARLVVLVGRARQHDFLPLAAGAVDDCDGLGTGRDRGRLLRRRAVVAVGALGRALRERAGVGVLALAAGAGGALVGRHDHHRLT